jgi:hypothetical protein
MYLPMGIEVLGAELFNGVLTYCDFMKWETIANFSSR